MSTSRSVAFHTLGCKLNYSETSSLSQGFKNAGYNEVDFEESADIYIVNTCSVTDQADKKCRKVIRSAQRRNPDSKIVVMGCYAQLKPEEICKIPGVHLVLGAAEKFNVLEHVQAIDLQSPHSRILHSEISEVNQFRPSYSQETRTRAFLKVQDGCDYKCTFCTIPLARGKSRSGTVEQIVFLAEELAEKQVKEVVLTGVNIGDFGNGTSIIEGTKIKKEAVFSDLIKELDKVEGIERFRISSIEPNLCTPEIIKFVAQSKRFVPHFHMPLQSGDNEILKQMKRRYLRELYSERVEYIKEIMPDACIGVDVIVGFPGETENHWENTYSFLEQLNIDYLHVFTYSERSNTPAALMDHTIPIHIRHQRSEALRNLSNDKRRKFYNRFIQTEQKVLLEQADVKNKYYGFSQNYLKIQIKNANDSMVNTMQNVRIEGFNSDHDLLANIQ